MDRTQTHGDVPDASGNAKVTDQKLPISDAQALITVERRTRGRHAGPGITRGLTLEQGKEKKIKKKQAYKNLRPLKMDVGETGNVFREGPQSVLRTLFLVERLSPPGGGRNYEAQITEGMIPYPGVAWIPFHFTSFCQTE